MLKFEIDAKEKFDPNNPNVHNGQESKEDHKSGKFKLNKREIIFYVSLVLMFFSAFFLWKSLGSIAQGSSSGSWSILILWVLFFLTFLSLAVILRKKKYFLEVAILFSFLGSFLFVSEGAHLLAFLFATGLALIFTQRVKDEMENRIKVSLWKSLSKGRKIIILALAILISSQYYLITKDLSSEAMLPRLGIDRITRKVIKNILPMVMPGFSEREEITVDEFLSSQLKNFSPGKMEIESSEKKFKVPEQEVKSEDSSSEIAIYLQDILKNARDTGEFSLEELEEMQKNGDINLEELEQQMVEQSQEDMLTETRENFSELVGREVKGDEILADVAAELVHTKINQFLYPHSVIDEGTNIFPIIVSFLLFVTIVPIGYLFSYLSILAAMLLFYILRKAQWVKISKKMVQVERIEE